MLVELAGALLVSGLAAGALWLVWGVSLLAVGAFAVAIGAVGQTMMTLRRWAAGITLVIIGALAGLVSFVWLLPAPRAVAPTLAVSPYLLPGVRPWPGGVVPVCWLNRPDRGDASADDLRMVLAVKAAEEAWSATGAVSFRDVGQCPSDPRATDFHGARLLIGRTIGDAEAPALGGAVGEQDLPVGVPFVFPSRSGCSSGGAFGRADVCTYGEAVHEIGHVLGLPDLHYSKAAPDDCKATLRGDHPALDVPYDAASVMNACNPAHLTGQLSHGDIQAVQQIYGR